MPALSAQRVLSRFLRGALANPEELSRQLRKNLDAFDEQVDEARKLQDILADIKKRKARGELSDEQVWEQTRTTVKDRAYYSILAAVYHGYVRQFRDTWDLSLAVLQKYSLSQPLRKKIEAIAKYWATKQNPRKPKLPKTTPEAEDATITLYLKYVELTRDQLGVITEAMTKGRPIAEGDAADPMKVKAGPFTLLNMGGFPDDVMQSAAEAVKKVADLATAKGFGAVCYGEVHISQKVGRGNVLAFYVPSQDELFVRADADTSEKHLHNILHELGHRYIHKALKYRTAPHTLYRIIGGQHYEAIREVKPQKGETVQDSKRKVTYEVTGVIGRKVMLRRQVPPDTLEKIRATAEATLRKERPELMDESQRGKDFIEQNIAAVTEGILRKTVGEASIDIEGYYQLKGLDPRTMGSDFKGFITPYAAKSPDENFAEMFAFYCRGDLPPTQTELFEAEVLGKGVLDTPLWG